MFFKKDMWKCEPHEFVFHPLFPSCVIQDLCKQVQIFEDQLELARQSTVHQFSSQHATATSSNHWLRGHPFIGNGAHTYEQQRLPCSARVDGGVHCL